MKYLLMAITFVIGELVAAIAFHLLKKRIGPEQSRGSQWESVLKGVLERETLLLGLLAGYPHVLTAYGALKISTRLSEDQKNQISNTYFLTGNLLSILFAMLYAVIINAMVK